MSAEVERLLVAARRLVNACDEVEIDRDTLQEPYYEWCAAVADLGRVVADEEARRMRNER